VQEPVHARDRIPGDDVRALRQQPAREHERRRLAHVVGVRLEREAEERHLAAAQRPEVPAELPDHAPLLQLVHLDDGVQQLEVVARVRGQLLQRQRVLGEARAAVADAGLEEARPDAPVEADPLRDLDDVRAGRLADVRDLVDERDPRHQRGVRGQLDHLGRGHVRAHDRRLDALVQLRHRVAVGLGERADHDPVRVQEVAHGRALGGELRVRHVADVAEAAVVEPRAHLGARPHRHGALHHDDRPALQLRQLVDDRPDRGQVGVARVRRRRADGDEHELGALDRLRHVERVAQAPAVPLQELVEPRLVDRHLPRLQRLDLRGVDVAHRHVVPEVRQARGGDEAHVAGAED
jgi:hypothetical protein